MFAQRDSVIFDLDGTLWDSTATVARAWQEALNKVSFDTEPMTQARVRSITGLPYDIIHPKLFPTLSPAQLEEIRELSAQEELLYLQREGGRLYAGLEDTLDYLKVKYPLFIVSNCQSGYIEAFLEYHRLGQYFSDTECFGNTHKSKADNLGAIIARNQLKAPVYVGDTRGDWEASQANGIPFIYTTFGFGEVPSADATISDFGQLRELL
jgi:phosphoglycolate phosphatase